METSRRIGAGVENIATFIKNWMAKITLFVIIAFCSLYLAGVSFNYLQYSKVSLGVTASIEKALYGKGWKKAYIYYDKRGEIVDYYTKGYEPYRKQYEVLPEPQRSKNLELLDETIETATDNYFISNGIEVDKGFFINLLICTLTPLLSFLFLGFLFRAPLADFRPFEKDDSIHGDARWATEKDIKNAGLREKKGIVIGRDNHGFLVAGGYQHALLFAPTGSGKGVGTVIPNLLYWEESCFIHDIKLENFELTSAYRRDVMKQDVFLWCPADPDGRTHCYNPLDWISPKPGQMVDDVQKIANLILPEQEFWTNEARTLFVGVTLYLLAVPEKTKSFGEVVRVLRSDDVVYNLAVVLDTIGKKIHPVSYMNIAAFLQKADKERSGVISTLNSGLELWANPLIDTATASSDFNIQNMKKKATTVYIGLTPDNIQRLQPLLQVFYQQATEFLARKIPDPKEEPYGVLFMMDEFPTLGEMKQFHAGIAYFRGYNVRLFLITQDTQQLKGIYEEHGMNTFLSNSTYRITFAANNVETANLISQLIGNKTVKQQSINKPKYLDLNPATRTIHESEIQRALLLPQEVIGLPRDEQIILIESTPPIRTKKIFYYKENFFKKRLLGQIEIPTQEPFDPRVLEEEKKKKEAEDKKKKEGDKKKKDDEKAKLKKDAEELEATTAAQEKQAPAAPESKSEAPPAPKPAAPAAPAAPKPAAQPQENVTLNSSVAGGAAVTSAPAPKAEPAKTDVPAASPPANAGSDAKPKETYPMDDFDLDFPDFPEFDDKPVDAEVKAAADNSGGEGGGNKPA